MELYDKITVDRIRFAHPRLREQLLRDYLDINKQLPKGIRLRFSHVLRTIAEQNELYAQGRTKKGNKVTNAKGGQSIHNYGLAFDIVILKDLDNNGTFETASWDQDVHFLKVIKFFKSKGYVWGGDFKSISDKPHFQFDYGFDWRTLESRMNKGITISEIIDGKEYSYVKI